MAKSNWLPRIQPDKEFRWDYDYIEIGDAPAGYAYGLADIDMDFHHGTSFGDEWTVGSSSSISSGSISPVDENNSIWDEETLASQASHSDNESAKSIGR